MRAVSRGGFGALVTLSRTGSLSVAGSSPVRPVIFESTWGALQAADRGVTEPGRVPLPAPLLPAEPGHRPAASRPREPEHAEGPSVRRARRRRAVKIG